MNQRSVRFRAMREGARALLVAAIGAAFSALGCSSGGGDGGACDAYKNEAPPESPITVRFTNDKSEPIFLGSQVGCGDIKPFALIDANDKSVEWHRPGCLQSCESIMAGQQIGCTADCLIPPVYLIEPGGHKDIAWQGTIFESITIDASCVPDPSTGNACQREARPAAGTYTIIGEAFLTASGCAAGAECACEPSVDGWCQLESSATVGSETVTSINTIVIPASMTEVELSFQ